MLDGEVFIVPAAPVAKVYEAALEALRDSLRDGSMTPEAVSDALRDLRPGIEALKALAT